MERITLSGVSFRWNRSSLTVPSPIIVEADQEDDSQGGPFFQQE